MLHTLIIPAAPFEQGQLQELEHDKPLTLRQLQDYVGGYIEHTMTLGGKDVFVDEDGRAKQRPTNRIASKICGQHIVGAAIVLLDWECP